MNSNRFITILELFLIVVIPFMTAGLDLFEDSKIYNQLFNFTVIENTIYRFKTDYTNSMNRSIFKDDSEFREIWKLIQAYTSAPLRSEPPYTISMLKVNNPQTVSLPYHAPDVILIPESAPIVAVYYEFPIKDGVKIPGKDIIIVGTIADLERWFFDAKKKIRITINMLISLMSIIFGLIIHIYTKGMMGSKEQSSQT